MAILDDIRAAYPSLKDFSDKEVADFVHQQYAPDLDVKVLYDKLGVKIPTSPNRLLATLPAGIESGFRSAQIGTNAAQLALGLGDKEALSARIGELQQRRAELAPSEETQKEMEAIQNAPTFGEAAKAIATSPRAVGRMALESIGSFAPDLLLAAGTGGLAGPTIKALATRYGVTRLAPEALGLAARTGTMAVATGIGSGKTEFGATYLEALQEAGVDISSSKELRKAFDNEELMTKARDEALKKGIPVGLFDAVSMGVAGRFYSKLAGATLGSKVAGGAAEFGMQAGLGMSGEAVGQLAQKGRITEPSSILMEGVLEGLTAAPEAALNLRGKTAETPATPATPTQIGTPQTAPTLTDEQRVRLEIPPDAESEFIAAAAKKYNFNEEQVAAILEASPEERTAFIAEVGKRDPDLLNLYSRPIAEEEAAREIEAQQGQALNEAEYEGRPFSRPIAEDKSGERLARLSEDATPVNSLSRKEELDKGVLDSQRRELADLEKIVDEFGAAAFEIPGVANNIRELRAAVREAEQLERTRVDKYGQSVEALPQRNPPPPKEVAPTEVPLEEDPTTTPVVKSVGRFINSLDQGARINMGALQGAVRADVGTTPTLPEVKDAFKQLGRLVRKGKEGYFRAYGTAQGEAAPVRGEVSRPQISMSAERATPEGSRLLLPERPTKVSQKTFNKVIERLRSTPEGRSVTVPQLVKEGIPQQQAKRMVQWARSIDLLQKGAVPRRTAAEVPNTLNAENTARLLSNELNGKTYGC